jgi:hypothetical protein
MELKERQSPQAGSPFLPMVATVARNRPQAMPFLPLFTLRAEARAASSPGIIGRITAGPQPAGRRGHERELTRLRDQAGYVAASPAVALFDVRSAIAAAMRSITKRPRAPSRQSPVIHIRKWEHRCELPAEARCQG